jgi:hypothetical protein
MTCVAVVTSTLLESLLPRRVKGDTDICPSHLLRTYQNNSQQSIAKGNIKYWILLHLLLFYHLPLPLPNFGHLTHIQVLRSSPNHDEYIQSGWLSFPTATRLLRGSRQSTV